jgi:hypothetical protein
MPQMKRPLLTFILEKAMMVCPFLFEVMTTMRWIARRTTISLFNYLVLEELRHQLTEQRARYKLFPREKQNGRFPGIAFLALITAILFIPLIIMSSHDQGSGVNPVAAFTGSFGLSGLPNLYENKVTISGNRITSDQRNQISQLGDPRLDRFSKRPSEEVQVIDLPFGSMLEWEASPDAIRSSLDDIVKNTSIEPFGTITVQLRSATTRNRVQTVTLTRFGANLGAEQREHLLKILNSTAGHANNTNITIQEFVPAFLQISYDGEPIWVNDYYYNASFQYIEGSLGERYWELDTSSRSLPAFFNTENATRVGVWSEKTPDQITAQLLGSAAGLLGL